MKSFLHMCCKTVLCHAWFWNNGFLKLIKLVIYAKCFYFCHVKPFYKKNYPKTKQRLQQLVWYHNTSVYSILIYFSCIQKSNKSFSDKRFPFCFAISCFFFKCLIHCPIAACENILLHNAERKQRPQYIITVIPGGVYVLRQRVASEIHSNTEQTEDKQIQEA